MLPFWDGDKAAAMELSRLITDVEPEHSERADLLFVARFDSAHDDSAIRQASRRFNVYTHVSSRRETGWPAGCNGLFFGGMEFAYHKMKSGEIPWYKAILICEADTVPIVKNWIETLINEWDKINKARTTRIAGAMVGGAQYGKQHLNGGCVMLSSEMRFLEWLNRMASAYSTVAGWDWALAEEFKAWGWADIPMMKSQWNRPTIAISDVEALRQAGVALLHGVKDDSLLKIARAMLVNT